MDVYELLRAVSSSPEALQGLAARRVSIFKQIHEIVFFGKGGYDFDTVYSLPIWLRHFIYKEIEESYRKEAEQVETARDSGQTLKKSAPNVPDAVKNKLNSSSYSISRPAKK